MKITSKQTRIAYCVLMVNFRAFLHDINRKFNFVNSAASATL